MILFDSCKLFTYGILCRKNKKTGSGKVAERGIFKNLFLILKKMKNSKNPYITARRVLFEWLKDRGILDNVRLRGVSADFEKFIFWKSAEWQAKQSQENTVKNPGKTREKPGKNKEKSIVKVMLM